MTPLGKLLAPVEERDPGARLRQAWRLAVGEKVASRSRALRLYGDTLLVAVATPVWSQELSLLSDSILGRLAELGVKAKQLRFRVQRLERDSRQVVRARPRVPRADLPRELEQRIATIDDPALRSVIGEAAAYTIGRAQVRARSKPSLSATPPTAPSPPSAEPRSGRRGSAARSLPSGARGTRGRR